MMFSIVSATISPAVTGAVFPGIPNAHIAFIPISPADLKSTPPGFDAKSISIVSLIEINEPLSCKILIIRQLAGGHLERNSSTFAGFL